MADIKLTLEVDGVRYGANFSINDEGAAIHYDFGNIIYQTLEHHFAANRQEVLPMIGVEERATLVTRFLHDAGIHVPSSR